MTRTISITARGTLPAFLSFVLLLSLAAGAVGAAAGNNSSGASAEWSPPGPFEADQLRAGGSKDADAPPSTRALGDPVRGGMQLRYDPVSPLQNDIKEIKPGSQIGADRIQVFSAAYGEATGEYTLVVVQWSAATKTVNGTDVTYAADQEVQRIKINVENGYSTQWIRLNSQYKGQKQVTMWLERNGEPVPGARWRFTHRSNPLTAAPGMPINSEGDLWKWGAMNILIPAIPGIFVGRYGAQHVLDRTIVGPQKGTVWWLFIVGFLALIATAVATWQTAAVLARAPYVAGLLISAIAFVAFLGFRDPEVEKAEFNQKDLKSTTTITGEEGKTARTEWIKLLNIVRRDGKIYAPASGFRPFFARYFANPAAVDEGDLKTVNNTEGDVSKKYELDPDLERGEALRQTPARLAFSPSLLVDEEPDPIVTPNPGEDVHPHVAAVMALPAGVVNAIGGVLQRLNWRFIGPSVIGGIGLYHGVMWWIGVQSLAAIAAILPTVVAGYQARDGSLLIEEAPYHFSDARAILSQERATYTEASTFEEMEELIADVDFDSIERTQDMMEAFRNRMRDRMDNMFGVSDETTPTADTGVADD